MWEILIIARTGETSCQGWSFDRDQEFSFNSAGIIWAEDLMTGARINDFPRYLNEIFPLERRGNGTR